MRKYYIYNAISSQLSSEKVDKTNITLEQHTDGLIYIFVNGQPVGNGVKLGTIVEGDIIGTIDENNNILLTGNLANGTYTLKYENEDGSYTDIGTLTVDTISPDNPEPDIPETNEINLFEEYTYQLNKRWSNSSMAWSGQNGSVGFELPMADIVGKTMRFSGFEQRFGINGDGKPSWYAYDDSNTLIHTYNNVFDLGIFTDEGNNTYSWVIPSISGATKLMVFLPITQNSEIYESSFANVSWTITDETDGNPETDTSDDNLADTTDTTDSAWVLGKRLNSSGTVGTGEGCVITNYVRCKDGDILRIKGLNLMEATGGYVCGYNESKAKCSDAVKFATYPDTITKVSEDEYTFDITANLRGYSDDGTLEFVRFSGGLIGTVDDVVITIVNESV